jgi:hypothetical protein
MASALPRAGYHSDASFLIHSSGRATMMQSSFRYTLIVVVLLLLGMVTPPSTDAFSIITPLAAPRQIRIGGSKRMGSFIGASPTKLTSTALPAIPKKTTNSKTKKTPAAAKKEPVTDPLQLFLAYATPWRNPNSIFVYMLLTLYILGSIEEAQRGM